MKRIEYLINDVRVSTDNTDTNAVTTAELVTYFNDAQYEIQATVFKTNPMGNIFTKTDYISTVGDQSEYALPSDIYAHNSIKMVSKFNGNQAGTRTLEDYYIVNPVQPEERRIYSGYWIEDTSLWLSPVPTFSQTDSLMLTYFKKLPLLSVRVGQVSSSISGTSVTMASGATDITGLDDFFCIVDKNGNIIAEGLNLNAYNNGTRVISTDSTFTGVTSSHFVVLGKLASTHTELPDVCEPLLKDYVRSRIHTRNASTKEVRNQSEFTQEQKNTIAAIFSDNQREVLYAPTTDSDFLRY